MKRCSCYYEEQIRKTLSDFERGFILGKTGKEPKSEYKTITIGRCLGTQEKEECTCNGDERLCDFYEYKRRQNKP